RDRDHPGPQRLVKTDELDAAVWGHVRGLLHDPATLLEQFEAFARQAEEETATARAEDQKWEGQRRRLDREAPRLLDAYQSEVIDLEELKERRPQLAGRRQALAAQRAQLARLRSERRAAQEVWADLKSFCGRVRGRLADATLAEKQPLVQLLIERVLVGEDTLEIRHVIPLRRLKPDAFTPAPPDGPDEGSGPGDALPQEAGARLRSEGVRQAELHHGMTFPHIAAVRREVITAQHTVELVPQHLQQDIPRARRVDLEQGVQAGAKTPGPPLVP